MMVTSGEGDYDDRVKGPVAPACVLLLLLATTIARGDDVPHDHRLGAGVKVGVIPPVFGALEFVVRPADHLVVGVFGIATPFAAFGHVYRALSIAPELLYEFSVGRRSTWFVEMSYLFYDAHGDNGFFEDSESAVLTAGYEWKWSALDLQAGGGLQYLVLDDVPPCTGVCHHLEVRIVPDLEIAARYSFN
jgi:hypothetical protein